MPVMAKRKRSPTRSKPKPTPEPKKPPTKRTRPTKAGLPLTPAAPFRGRTLPIPVPKPNAPTPRVPVPTPEPAPRIPTLDPLASIKRRAETLITKVRELGTKLDADFYDLAVALLELSRPDVIASLGYTNFDDLLEQRDLVKREQAYRYLKVAQHLDAATAHRLGIERAYHAIRYAELVFPRQPVATVIARDPTIRFEGTHRLSTIPTRLLRRFNQAQRDALLPEPPPTLERTTRSLSQRLHIAGLENVHVESRFSRGKPYVTVFLPLSEAQKLAARLKP
jgi:hypothetical protein